ncbi:MAG: hypothetical protein GY835_06360 [bacterium]|nr:hypothetical protein [bacterium]
MMRSIRIALLSYLAPLASARATRMTCVLMALLLMLVVTGRLTGFLPPTAFINIADSLILYGIPLFAVLLSEMSLRDGITHRTLLYPLLGPVSRTTIAVTRTLATGLLLFVSATLTLICVKVLGELSWSIFPQELAALFFGSIAYVAFFGLIHAVNSKALIISLCVFTLFDLPVGRLPFTMRNLAPSFHLRVLSDKIDSISIPVMMDVSDPSLFFSAMVMVLVTIVATTLTALLFSRRNLVNLC